jgi:hypothetical protein
MAIIRLGLMAASTKNRSRLLNFEDDYEVDIFPHHKRMLNVCSEKRGSF